MGAPGLERHRLALLAAREDVGNPRAATNWAVFAYEKHHDLRLLDSGAGGVDELAAKFCASSIMYGLCRVRDPGSGAPRVVLISWVGEEVPESQRQACAGHLPAIRAFFKEATAVLSARRAEEVTQEGLSRVLAQLAPAAAPSSRRSPPADGEELVGTNYRKTNPALEIRRTKRDSFWAQAEREEEQRKEEERRRALEERRRWERERMEEERRDAAERERRCREKEQRIEEQRKEQARIEAEERRKEQQRWEQQQREHEAAMRDRFRRSESIEKAAEAAVLVAQRTQNPRDFFRQRERAGSASGSTSGTALPAGPLGTRPGARRPFLRYQRSLTESAFIFRRPETPASPTAPDPGAFQAAAPPSPRRPPGTPTGPAGVGPPHAGSPVGTWRPPCAALGSPPRPPGAGTPSPISPPGPPAGPSRLQSPPGPPGSGPSDGTRRAEPLPPSSASGLGPPSSTAGGPPPLSPPRQPPTGTVEDEALPLPSPPSTPLDEEGPPPGTPPLPSPPAWGAPELPVGPGEGVLSPREGPPPPGLPPVPPPPRSPSPPGPKDAALPCELQQGTAGEHQAEPKVSNGGQNGLGDWAPPWEPPKQGGGATILPQPLHKAKPGFTQLLTPGASPPPEDKEFPPHTV
ncbi:LOW QUALITY PROTEIN: drebrin-like protein A [Tympanuchus pallidicinctus]|uniref:LOW QUALITY PROTEIN: drebrin-like protein A n=1 Tax=Tympanuchus pallidicinctus TaxID=109042 RepID=UPI002286F488|nr:LOW QUALITY PROTEIN: drebrin-like protein A [Tympanuchus pallidicinctus]